MRQQSPERDGDAHRQRFAHVSRRSWLAGAVLGLSGASTVSPLGWSMQAREGDSDEKKEIVQVQAIAKKAGLEPFTESRTTHFLGLGDADARFRTSALSICESLAPAFIQHFNGQGFKLQLPKHRLTVITLKSAESYQAFIGEDPGAFVGGHYDLDTNRLVMFDFRPKGDEPGVVIDPVRVNRLALVHEATHLLCFNSGLLSRQAIVPDWVSEGLATYVELWRNKQTRIGEPNRPWIFCLNDAKTSDVSWIPITNLGATDNSFRDKMTAQLSYAESWLLVHYLMKTPVQLPRFRAYLSGLQSDEAVTKRVEYAEKHLGPLKALDHELARHLKRVAR
jgi:Protein of unknown function (DUF1570)